MGDRSVKGDVKHMNQRNKWFGRIIPSAVLLCLVLGMLAGCSSDGIKKETMNAVREKKSQVLALYSDVEKLVKEHSINVDETFYSMKDSLVDMSEKVEKMVEDTTEADGQRALEELERLRENLQTTKNNVESHIAQ